MESTGLKVATWNLKRVQPDPALGRLREQRADVQLATIATLQDQRLRKSRII